MLQNYEVIKNSVTTNDDIIAHANQEKEKLLAINQDDNVTSNIICRAVRDLFGGAVKKVNKRIDKSFKRAFLNLRRRDQVLAGSDNEIEEQWEKLRSKASTIAKEAGDGEWQVLVGDKFSISFVRLENTRCDGRVMVSEVRLKRNTSEQKIETEILYDRRAVKIHLTETIDEQLGIEDIVIRVKSVLSLVDKSYVCSGFLACEIDDTLELYQVKVEKHFITFGDISEER